MNNTKLLILALVLACSSGCAQLERTLTEAGIVEVVRTPTQSGAVRVRAADGRVGHAAIVERDRVVTVAHVVGAATTAWVDVGRSGAWVEARVVQRIAHVPEELVVLEVARDAGWLGAVAGFTGFAEERVLQPAPEAPHSHVLTTRGLLALATAELRPGDSGAPVVDERGRLVGLLSGRGSSGAVVTFLGSSAPTASPTRWAPASSRNGARGRRGPVSATTVAASVVR